MGVIPGAQFEIRSLDIEPGDTLLAFTDGITEAQSPAGEFFGRERLYGLVAQPASTAGELLNIVQASVREFMGDGHQSDDIALLAVRRQ